MATSSTSSGSPVGHTVNTVAIIFGVITICVITIRLYGRIALVRAVGADDGSLYPTFMKLLGNNTDIKYSFDSDCECMIPYAGLSQTLPNMLLVLVMGLYNCNYSW